MTRCSLDIQNPKNLNRRLESPVVTVPAGETSVEIDIGLSVSERTDPAVRLIVDTFLSRDGGATWIHRHREYWDGQDITLRDGSTMPRPTSVVLSCPAEECHVKLEVSKWPSP